MLQKLIENLPYVIQMAAMIRTVLKKELDVPVVEIKEDGVNIQGADVIFTGKKYLVFSKHVMS